MEEESTAFHNMIVSIWSSFSSSIPGIILKSWIDRELEELWNIIKRIVKEKCEKKMAKKQEMKKANAWCKLPRREEKTKPIQTKLSGRCQRTSVKKQHYNVISKDIKDRNSNRKFFKRSLKSPGFKMKLVC